MKTAVLILAAGRSVRMGTPKAWLRLDGRSLLQSVIETASAINPAELVVVAGAERGEHLLSIESMRQRGLDATAVVGCPDETPIDSIRAGLAMIPPDRAVFVWPIDHPFATAEHLRALVGALGDRKDLVARPKCQSGSGHPVLFGSAVAQELRDPVADGGARAVVRSDPARVVDVPCADPRLAAPLNTPEEAAALGVTGWRRA